MFAIRTALTILVLPGSWRHDVGQSTFAVSPLKPTNG